MSGPKFRFEKLKTSRGPPRKCFKNCPLRSIVPLVRKRVRYEILVKAAGNRGGSVASLAAWDEEKAPDEQGTGVATFHRDQAFAAVWNYGDKLQIDSELRASHGSRGTLECRQCIILSTAAAMLVSKLGRQPTPAEINELALEIRWDVWSGAAEAGAALGDAPPLVPAAESDLRVFVHDALAPNHDKDFRTLQVLPPSVLSNVVLHVVLLDRFGNLSFEELRGKDIDHSAVHAWMLFHDSHARVLIPTVKFSAATLSQSANRSLNAEGWELFLESGNDDVLVQSQSAASCARCKKDNAFADATRRAGRNAIADRPGLEYLLRTAMFGSHLDFDCDSKGGASKPQISEQPPVFQRPCFAWGPVFLEILAGLAPMTKAAKAAKHHTVPPIELYADPIARSSPQEASDLRRVDVQKSLYAQARAPPGPDSPNAFIFQNPCGSFCDWMLLNKGTRTFANPDGDGSRPTEVDANMFAAVTSATCETLELEGKLWVIEQQMPSGRYPKLIDLKRVKQMLHRTGARTLVTSMCMVGKAPRDQPEARYRTRALLIYSPSLHPVLLAMRRTCAVHTSTFPSKAMYQARNSPALTTRGVTPQSLQACC